MDAVEAIRDDGIPAFYTMDAGPHVKVLTTAEHVEEVRAALARVDGVRDILVSKPGPGIE
jgi:diphosphomevalonate decarboxylase